jgi:hypothetical protein
MRVSSAAAVAAAGWQGLAAGKPVVVPDLLTRIGLQSLRVLPWQMIARTSQSRHRGGPLRQRSCSDAVGEE